MNVLALLCLTFGVTSVVSDSCQNRCFTSADQTYNCQCNTLCIQYGDCCSDYNIECDTTATCANRNCNVYDSTETCQCNSQCDNYSNCCPDRQEVCTTTTTTTTTTTVASDSCTGRCGQSPDNTKSCQCNDVCANYGDCCSDYTSVCQGSSGGNDNCGAISVSNSELETISWAMWLANTNNFPYDAIEYDIQGSTSTSDTNDVAPNPFFTYVDESLLQGDMYQRLIALQDNYIRTQGNTEVVTQEELNENDAFLDAFLNTAVGQELFDFLDSKNLAGCDGIDGFKTILDIIWFGMYERQAPDDTSGFEHAFVGEIKGSGVSGFHNWVHFYHEEQADNFNYQGYVTDVEPRTVGMRHTWYGATKKMNGFTIGTSPEIEFGLYTLCYLTRPGSACYITMGDEYNNQVDASIQTYTWDNEGAPNGLKYIASSYFRS